jgi:RND family efflux transporter MFP subunit
MCRLHWSFCLLVLPGLASSSGCGNAAGSLPAQTPPKVTVARPISRTVHDVEEYTGRVAAVETVDVRARITGYVQEVYFHDGETVKKGHKLFLIDPRTYKAELEQAESKIALYDAKYRFAESVKARNEKLAANKAISEEEYEQSRASAAEALAARQAAEADRDRAKLNVDFTEITAEIDGRIDRVLVTVGNLVESSPNPTLLTTIVSVKPMYVYFDPDEMAFLRYMGRRAKEGVLTDERQHVVDRKIKTTIVFADGTHYPETGIVDFASNRVDPSTGTIQVRAVFENKDNFLTPGVFVRVRVQPEESYRAVLVPERAIGTDQSDKFVYVVDDKNVAQRRNVKLGTKQGKLRVIQDGITAADRVAISGTLLVRPGMPVEAEEGTIEEDKTTKSAAAPPAATSKPAPADKPGPADDKPAPAADESAKR